MTVFLQRPSRGFSIAIAFFLCGPWLKAEAFDELNMKAHNAVVQMKKDLEVLAETFGQLSWVKGAQLTPLDDGSTSVLQQLKYQRGVMREEVKPGKNGGISSSAEKVVLGKDHINFYFIISERPLKIKRSSTVWASKGPIRLEICYLFDASESSEEIQRAVERVFERISASFSQNGFTIKREKPTL